MGIFFLPYYLLLGLQLVMPAGTIPKLWEPVLILLWLLCISWFFFSKIIVYVLISLIAVTSGLAAFMWGHKGLPLRILSLLGALSVIALPWLFPYQPALNAAPGYMMQSVTQPSNPVLGFVKMAYLFSDGVPCEYDLLGWSAENQLYYQSQCEGETRLWSVNPYQPNEYGPIEALPSELDQEKIAKSDVLEMVRADGIRPESAEPTVREIKLLEGSLLSPDGQWLAAITQHIYGPQDVVLLKNSK
jgi:hypothetical protein